jgi:hypothetical protein
MLERLTRIRRIFVIKGEHFFAYRNDSRLLATSAFHRMEPPGGERHGRAARQGEESGSERVKRPTNATSIARIRSDSSRFTACSAAARIGECSHSRGWK